jgi:hypothetical protein
MIEPLLGLRQALDRAIAAVQAVEPAVAAWQGSRAGLGPSGERQERAGRADGAGATGIGGSARAPLRGLRGRAPASTAPRWSATAVLRSVPDADASPGSRCS